MKNGVLQTRPLLALTIKQKLPTNNHSNSYQILVSI